MPCNNGKEKKNFLGLSYIKQILQVWSKIWQAAEEKSDNSAPTCKQFSAYK